MALYSSAFADKGRQTMIGPDGNLITGTIQPNVSNFGWTSNDMTSVTELVKWVGVAQDAATSASNNADYVEQVYKVVQTQEAALAVKITEVETLATNTKTEVDSKVADIDSKIATLNNLTTTVQGYYNNAAKKSQWASELYDAIAKAYTNLATAFPSANLPALDPKPVDTTTP